MSCLTYFTQYFSACSFRLYCLPCLTLFFLPSPPPSWTHYPCVKIIRQSGHSCSASDCSWRQLLARRVDYQRNRMGHRRRVELQQLGTVSTVWKPDTVCSAADDRQDEVWIVCRVQHVYLWARTGVSPVYSYNAWFRTNTSTVSCSVMPVFAAVWYETWLILH